MEKLIILFCISSKEEKKVLDYIASWGQMHNSKSQHSKNYYQCVNIHLENLAAGLGFCGLSNDSQNGKQHMYCLHVTPGYVGNQQGEPLNI